MNYLRRPLLGFTVLFSIPFLNAQTPDTLTLSLHEVWERVKEHSREVAMKETQTEISKAEVLEAQLDRLPEWKIGGELLAVTNMPIYENGFKNPTYWPVPANHLLYGAKTDFFLNIYNGSKTSLKIKEEKALLQISKIAEDEAISDIRYKAASLYLELQKSSIFRNIIQEDIADQEKQLKEIYALYKNAVVLKSDVLREELTLSQRKFTLVQIENDIEIANQKLNILMGEDDETVVIPADLEIAGEQEVGTYEHCLNEALAKAFAIQTSEKRTELSKLNLKKVRGNYAPSVALEGEFRVANPQIFLYPYAESPYTIGIGGLKVSYPISSLYHNAYKTKAAKLELEKEEIAHKDTEDRVRQQVREAYLRYLEALVQIEVAEKNVEQSTENARIIKNAYFNQTVLITDLLDADIQVLRSQFEMEAAKISAQNKYYLLQNVIGIL